MTEVVHRRAGRQPRLAEVTVLRHEIAQAADELNVEIQAVEAAFVAMRLKVRASVALGPGPTATSECDALVFGRHHGSWRLLYATETHGGAGRAECLLVTAPRAARLAAVGALPELLAEVLKEAQGELDALRAATEQVAAFAKALSGASAEGQGGPT